MDETEVLRTLRAVRSYADEPIPDTVLDDVLEAARWTGSSKNTQPWELVVVRDRTTLEALSQLGAFAGHLAGAACGIALVMAGTSTSVEFDAGRLAQTIMLAAWAHGVGSCIASLYPADNQRRAAALLSVPPDRQLHTVIALGYPRDAGAVRLRSAPSNVRAAVPLGRKGPREIVGWERYGRPRP
ncbi:MAG TPA: nitroreductase family protein [Thermomicrobiaceae bacterium]|nr:nitroreductase family protein [Thermomicrobiaceae bacterium]